MSDLGKAQAKAQGNRSRYQHGEIYLQTLPGNSCFAILSSDG
jgi:hypothetical protein